MNKHGFAFWVLWAFALSGFAQEYAVPPPPPATRDPEMRQIDPAKDGAVLKRIEFFAHSGIQDFEGLSTDAQAAIAEISLKPAAGRFKTLCVNQNEAVEGFDCWQRDVDTEYKIIEDLAARLPDMAAKGRMLLFTELYPCPSCWNVMKQFLSAYPNVEMLVLYRTP